MRIWSITMLSLVVFAGCFIDGTEGDTDEFGPNVQWLSPKHPEYPGVAQVITGQPPEVVEAFRRFNEVRMDAGLKPVTFDAQMSRDVKLHCHYLLLNHGAPEIAGLLAHSEFPSLPGYTPEGENAGHKSILSSVSVERAVDVFLNTFYHRVPILSPSLTRIGIGWDTLDGRHKNGIMLEYGGDSSPYPIAYPDDGQEQIPLAFNGENPDPVPVGAGVASFPVTLTFAEHVTDVVAALYDAQGNEVDVHLSTPDEPAIAHPQKNTVCLLAKKPFLPAERYTVEVSATHSTGERTNWRWSFTTAVPVEVNANDEAALEAAVGKFVRVTGPVARSFHTTSRAWYLGGASSHVFIAWIQDKAWSSFTDAGVASHDYLTGTSVSVVGELRKRENGYEMNLAHHSYVRSVSEHPVAVDTPAFEAVVESRGKLVRLETAGARLREPWNGLQRIRLGTSDGTYLSAYISEAALDGASVDELVARSVSITGVVAAEGESETSYLIYVERPEQWAYLPGAPQAIDADVPDAVIDAHGYVVRSTGSVRNPKEENGRRYFAYGSNGGGTWSVFVYVSDAAWRSLQSRGVTNFEDLHARRVEVLGAPVMVTASSAIYVERGDQIALLP